MKRIICHSIFILMVIVGQAQTISVSSFKLLDTDLTANTAGTMEMDQNGETAALIKVVTTQTGFTFDGGVLGIVRTKQTPGEIWVYIPRGSKKISIKHQKWGILRDYYFPLTIDAARTYEMELIVGGVKNNKQDTPSSQYVVFQLAPPDAIVELDGELIETKDGFASKMVKFGTFNYRVQAPNYSIEAGSVTVDDPENIKILKVFLKPEANQNYSLDDNKEFKETSLNLYLASLKDNSDFNEAIIHFIKKYPNAPEGYTYRAQLEANNGDYESADKDMAKAISLADKKDDVLFHYARIIYNKEINQNARPYAGWNLEKALQQIQAANAINPHPTYRQMEANIRFAMQQYQEAYDIYQEQLATNLRSAELFFAAARCKEMQKDTTTMLALMDSAVNMFSRPYQKEAAPYIWARSEARRNAGHYRDAVNDMNDYETIMATTVNDNFYYIRFEVELQARLFKNAYDDIKKAIKMNPNEILYFAEKASLEIRVGLYEQAIISARECIRIDSTNSDGYLFLGLAQCIMGNKKEGITNLKQALELGDSQAEALIQKYGE